MMIRVVKMILHPDGLFEFTAFFEAHKYTIEAFPGCLSVDLYKDVVEPNMVMTYSIWETKAHLEKYRNSKLFGTIWPQAKLWFADKPMAWSFSKI